MDLLDELARSDIDPAMLAQVRALFKQQQVTIARQEAVLAERDFKITALTHELAYYRPIRFSKASEALAGEQRLLFAPVRKTVRIVQSPVALNVSRLGPDFE